MREDVPRHAIFPYVKSSAVYKCPDDPASKGVSYLANYYRMGLSTAANGAYVTRQLSAINSPSTVIALMDGLYIAGGTRDPGNATTGYGLNTEYIIYNRALRLYYVPNALPRHSTMANILFADGHAKNSQPLPLPSAAPDLGWEAVFPFNTYINPFKDFGTQNDAWDGIH